MTAPPPEDPEGPHDPSDLDFDAEFERLIADWQPAEPRPQGEPAEATDPAPAEPAAASAEPVDPRDDGLRNLFRSAWPDDMQAADADEDVEEHFVPPPAPPIPRPEPRRLIAWVGLAGVPVLALVLLVLGALPSWASFLLFSWFVGSFVYLVATMAPRDQDGWDDGARI